MLPSTNQHMFTRLMSSVALVALAGGALYAKPGVVLDRGRQTRLGTSRSAGSGTRFDAFHLDSHVNPVEADPGLSNALTVVRVASAKTVAPTWRPLPAVAHTPPGRPFFVAPQPGAYVSLPGSRSPLVRPITSPSGRGPPTL